MCASLTLRFQVAAGKQQAATVAAEGKAAAGTAAEAKPRSFFAAVTSTPTESAEPKPPSAGKVAAPDWKPAQNVARPPPAGASTAQPVAKVVGEITAMTTQKRASQIASAEH